VRGKAGVVFRRATNAGRSSFTGTTTIVVSASRYLAFLLKLMLGARLELRNIRAIRIYRFLIYHVCI
jgi:hypothetical protein